LSDTIGDAINETVSANAAGIRLLRAGAELDLSSKGVDASQANHIAEELSGNMTVATLVLSKNEIGDEGCMDIAKALVKNHILTSIELGYNSISAVGCSALAATLQGSTVLTKILLDGNSIGLAGATSLAEALISNTCLQHLGLGRNNIGNDGTTAIAGALRTNTSLARLDLDENDISDEGAMAILATLKNYNCGLMSLNLDVNPHISQVPRKALDFVLASRLVLSSFCKCLHRPLENRSVPLAIRALQQSSVHQERLGVARPGEAGAGPVFYLMRSTALNGL
jgi:Leucine Rich repeat